MVISHIFSVFIHSFHVLFIKYLGFHTDLDLLLSGSCIVFHVQWSLLYFTHSGVFWVLWVFALNIPKSFWSRDLSVRNPPLIPSLPYASITTLLSIATAKYRLPAPILKLPPKSRRRVTQLLFLCWWDRRLPITLTCGSTVAQSTFGVTEEVTYFSLWWFGDVLIDS